MSVSLNAEIRNFKGRRSRNLLDGQGKTPAVVYGKGIDSKPITVDSITINKILKKFGTSQLLKLNLDNEQYNVVIKDVQYHPITQRLIHLDFHRVRLDKLTKSIVPIVLVGEPEGMAKGCILQQHLREVEVECLPTDIPEAVNVDVSNLKVDESVHITDLEEIKGVGILDAPDTLIATLFYPEQEEVPEEGTESSSEPVPELVSDKEPTEEE